jgi:hypothetical protein
MPIGDLERNGVSTPKCVVRRIGDGGARLLYLSHDRIHFGLARDIVAERTLGGAPLSRPSGRVRMAQSPAPVEPREAPRSWDAVRDWVASDVLPT